VLCGVTMVSTAAEKCPKTEPNPVLYLDVSDLTWILNSCID
jgi:hypothetical protein